MLINIWTGGGRWVCHWPSLLGSTTTCADKFPRELYAERGRTEFTRLAVDLDTLVVDTADFTFTNTSGPRQIRLADCSLLIFYLLDLVFVYFVYAIITCFLVSIIVQKNQTQIYISFMAWMYVFLYTGCLAECVLYFASLSFDYSIVYGFMTSGVTAYMNK